MSRTLDRFFKVATGLCAIGSCALFLGIAGTILFKGLPAVEWNFLLQGSSERFGSGGVLYHILGTIILIGTALAVSAPLAIGLSLVQTTYLRSVRAKRRLRLAIYTANGVPSILFGIFGLIVFGRFLGWGKSWLAGGIVLGAMILPTLTVALVERIEALPRKYIAAAAACGLNQPQIIRSVILPQSRGGLLVGALLGLARAAGETAPIMFTAAVFSGATLPSGIRESPVLALPYHVFVLAQDSFAPGANTQMWGAAVVLLGLVLLLSLMALPARLRSAEEARHG
jgi:phosphate transport system permease protein